MRDYLMSNWFIMLLMIILAIVMLYILYRVIYIPVGKFIGCPKCGKWNIKHTGQGSYDSTSYYHCPKCKNNWIEKDW